jgi:hypothetical protein
LFSDLNFSIISTAPPFVLRLSKDERRVFQQNQVEELTLVLISAVDPVGLGDPVDLLNSRLDPFIIAP